MHGGMLPMHPSFSSVHAGTVVECPEPKGAVGRPGMLPDSLLSSADFCPPSGWPAAE